MPTFLSHIIVSKPFRVSLTSTLLIEVILWIGLKWEILYIVNVAVGQYFLASYISISMGVSKHCDYFCFPTTAMPGYCIIILMIFLVIFLVTAGIFRVIHFFKQ